jgi:REP element-mobilizing transposase RayT
MLIGMKYMKTNAFEPERRPSLRLKNYDYSQPGAYFITICTQDRICLFADGVSGQSQGIAPTNKPELLLNDAGHMVEETWRQIPTFYSCVDIDAVTVMPNHVHGILIITDRQPPPRISLPQIVQRFKSLTTRRYIDGVRKRRWQPFSNRLWQRSYYDHIIRDEAEMNDIRDYILNNPIQWSADHENPANR